MENELYHHGVLGQKWGVRRYQNKDGSLTMAGKKRICFFKNSLRGKYKDRRDDRRGCSFLDPPLCFYAYIIRPFDKHLMIQIHRSLY